MEQDYNLKKWSKGCPNTGVNCRRSSCGIEYVFIPAALGDDQEGGPVAPKNGSYNNAIVYYEATGNVYLYSSDGVPTRVEKNLDSIIAELQRELDDVEEALSEETSAREAADAAIEQEIEDLRNEPDVVDIVGTYADLQAYDTSDLGDKDIIRVLVDEMHDNESTYYRWNKTPQTWTYIGAVEGYYTRGQTDALLDEKQDTLTAGANIQINGTTISATDTTYSAGTGLNLNGTEFSVDTTTIAEKSDIPTTAAEVHALPDTTKYGASLTLTIDSSTYVATATLKDQDGNTLGTAQTIDLPLESVVVSGSYDSQTKEVVLTLQSGSTIRFSVADLVSGLQETLIAGANIQIAADGKTISATDTTYTAGTGLNLTGTQFSIDNTTVATQSDLVTGLAGKQDTLTAGANITIDANNVISAAGGGSGPTVVQSPGTSTTNVMSQNATTAMVFADPNTRRRIQIGASTYTASGVSGTVSIGAGSSVQQDGCVAIGASSGGVAAFPAKGMVHIGTADTRYGYNSSNYRLLTGLYEPQSAHDAANKEYVDGRVLTNAGAPTTSTVGTVGQILEDTTNGKLYICTDATDPYVWEEVGSGGGSGGVSDVQIDGASIVSGGVATIPFAASSSAGVIKVGTAVSTYMGSDNRLSATTRTYEDYTSGSAAMFIGKGTLENVITGKGLVTNTTYPDNGDAGVIKVGASYGTSIASSGHLISSVRTYETYSTAGAYMFISKGTLENVIAGKGLVDQTDLATKQDKLTAGTNITIDANNVISATGGGGASPITITITPDQQTDDMFTWSGATVSEIQSAFDNGTEILVNANNNIFKAIAARSASNFVELAIAMDYFHTTSLYLRSDGTGELDMVTFATASSVAEALEGKQDTLTAGTGISITNGVISCTFANGNGVSY